MLNNHNLSHAFSLRRFGQDKRGGVAIIFALTLVPIIGVSGAAVDYASASSTRSRMSQAADAAALAAVKTGNGNRAERDRIARQVFNANIGTTAVQNLSFRVIETSSGVRVEANADVMTSFLPVIGIDRSNVGVVAEVQRNDGTTEVALVLDVTGSMVNDMPALRTSSANFINTLFSFGSTPGAMKVGVVPYVGAVNPGRINLGMSSVDATAESTFHAAILKYRGIAWMQGCDPWLGQGPGAPQPNPGRGGRGVWLQDNLKKLANAGQELFGIKPAAALGETPNTRAPFTGTMQTGSPPNAPVGTQALVPSGFVYNAPCNMANPSRINHLDLFDRIPGAQWKGCVEARPEPYDVTDDAPTADPRTKFVPYFWADEAGQRGQTSSFANNYMDDGPLPTGWTFTGADYEKTYNLFKYNGSNAATQTASLGPNKACPDELQRLTSDKATLLNKVGALQMGIGSGTISSEGVAWGWRVLTPKRPFADGLPYSPTNRKFLVLMSDGENEIGENNVNGPVMSHYSAYGYLRHGRFPSENFQVASTYLDQRFSLVCRNAKAAGITIMAVYFRDTNVNAKSLMQACASEARFFYEAPNARALETAFQSIASEIGKLRITK